MFFRETGPRVGLESIAKYCTYRLRVWKQWIPLIDEYFGSCLSCDNFSNVQEVIFGIKNRIFRKIIWPAVNRLRDLF